MRILNEITKSWRNFFYANQDNIYYEPKDLLISLEIVRNSRSDILDAVMDDVQEKEAIIKDAKEEIAYQRKKIKDIFKEFMEFTSVDTSSFDVEETVDYIINYNTTSEFYIVINEWEELGNKAHEIWDNLNDRYGKALDYIHDNLCEIIMDAIYDFTKHVENKK